MKNDQQGIDQLQPCSAGFLQFDVILGEPERNITEMKRRLADLSPASPGMVVLPELWSAGFDYPRMVEHSARTPEILDLLREEAERYGIYLAGSLPEAKSGDGRTEIFNTLYMVDSRGVAGRIRKQHLFGPMGEDAHFSYGDDPGPVATGLGLFGGLVCFDLRFPDLARHQASQGAEVMIVSAQWPAARREHWQLLLRARAVENQIFVIGCNRCGTTGDTEFGGHSMVVAPDGKVLLEAGEGPEQRTVELDPGRVTDSRRLFTSAGLSPYRFPDQAKIKDLDVLKNLAERYRRLGRRMVFTNGCFDILHRGHVTYLEEARRLGDFLVVGLNSDASVSRLKGPERPVNDEYSRARVLAGLGCVDHVVLFSEETPLRVISELLPDILVKGGDWPVEKIVGAAEVTAAGGMVLSIPLVGSFSTTALINRINQGAKS